MMNTVKMKNMKSTSTLHLPPDPHQSNNITIIKHNQPLTMKNPIMKSHTMNNPIMKAHNMKNLDTSLPITMNPNTLKDPNLYMQTPTTTPLYRFTLLHNLPIMRRKKGLNFYMKFHPCSGPQMLGL